MSRIEASGDVEQNTTVLISCLREGSLTVVIDDNEFTDYQTAANQETHELNLLIILRGDNDIV